MILLLLNFSKTQVYCLLTKKKLTTKTSEITAGIPFRSKSRNRFVIRFVVRFRRKKGALFVAYFFGISFMKKKYRGVLFKHPTP